MRGANTSVFGRRRVSTGSAGTDTRTNRTRAREQAWAERMVKEELKRRRWTEEELALRRKGDSQKVPIARRLRRDTTMTLHWIAERLKMGTAGSLANLLRNSKAK